LTWAESYAAGCSAESQPLHFAPEQPDQLKEMRVFKSIRTGSVKSGFTIVGVFNDSTALPKAVVALDEDHALAQARKRPGYKADAGEFQDVSDQFALIGLGSRKDLTTARLRTVGARLAKGLDRIGAKSARLVLGEAIAESSIEPGRA